MVHGHGGRHDGLPMACGHGFLSLGTRRPRPQLSGLWTDDAHLRSSAPPLPYLGRSGASHLQAQPLSRSGLSGARQDQEPGTGNHPRSAPGGHRLGRLLLDRTSTLFAPHGDLLDPIRTPGRLRDQALRRCHRPVHPTLPGHARGAAARRRVAPPTIRIRGGNHDTPHRTPPQFHAALRRFPLTLSVLPGPVRFERSVPFA